MLKLGPGVQGVVFHDNGAEPQRGVEGNNMLWTVGQRECYPVPFPHTGDSQRLGGSTYLFCQLTVGRLRTEEVERDPVPEAHSAGGEHLRQGLVRDLDLGINPRRIACQPRTPAEGAVALPWFQPARAVHIHLISPLSPTRPSTRCSARSHLRHDTQPPAWAAHVAGANLPGDTDAMAPGTRGYR